METKVSGKKKATKKKLDEEVQESLLMVITFHSMEEKLVSQAMARWKKSKLGDQATKKPFVPSELEISENSRSKSAKLYSFIFDY